MVDVINVIIQLLKNFYILNLLVENIKQYWFKQLNQDLIKVFLRFKERFKVKKPVFSAKLFIKLSLKK